MINTNQNPTVSPDNNNSGQPAGNPPEGGQKPPAVGNDQPSGGVSNQDTQMTQISLEELNALKRKSGRWDANLKRNREDRRNGRRSKTDYNTDGADPELLDTLKDRDDKINELSSVNVKLQVKDKVRDLLDSDEYKDVSQGIRRAIGRNPLGFANSSAKSVEEAIADIQDYLDDELDRTASQNPANGGDQPAGNLPVGNPPNQNPLSNIPPASGSGPSNPQIDINQGVEGKTGSKRSTAVLQNILKGPRKKTL